MAPDKTRSCHAIKNKVVDLSYLNEICVVCCYGVRETFHGSPEQKEFSSRCKRRVNYQHVFFTLTLDI